MSVLIHVGLCVSDIARAERFYCKGLGFVRDRELRLPGSHINSLMQIEPESDIHAVYLVLGGQTLELIAFAPDALCTAPARQFNQTGLTHLSIAVEDIAAALTRCGTLGGSMISHVGRAAILRDPDGQLIEVLDLAVHREIEQARATRITTEG